MTAEQKLAYIKAILDAAQQVRAAFPHSWSEPATGHYVKTFEQWNAATAHLDAVAYHGNPYPTALNDLVDAYRLGCEDLAEPDKMTQATFTETLMYITLVSIDLTTEL